MKTISIEEAQTHLAEVIAKLDAGEGLVIVRNGQPVAQLIGLGGPSAPSGFGINKGKLTIVSDDGDHLKEEKGTF